MEWEALKVDQEMPGQILLQAGVFLLPVSYTLKKNIS